jgi:hypothetical protein
MAGPPTWGFYLEHFRGPKCKIGPPRESEAGGSEYQERQKDRLYKVSFHNFLTSNRPGTDATSRDGVIQIRVRAIATTPALLIQSRGTLVPLTLGECKPKVVGKLQG